MDKFIHLQTDSQTIPGFTIVAYTFQTITKNTNDHARHAVVSDNQTVDGRIHTKDGARQTNDGDNQTVDGRIQAKDDARLTNDGDKNQTMNPLK